MTNIEFTNQASLLDSLFEFYFISNPWMVRFALYANCHIIAVTKLNYSYSKKSLLIKSCSSQNAIKNKMRMMGFNFIKKIIDTIHNSSNYI